MATRKGKLQRESQYVRVAKLAYQITRAVLPEYWHKNSPKTYSVPQVAACVLLMGYLNKSYRDTEEWLLATDQVTAALGLQAVPDHSTLQRMYQRLHRRELDALNRHLLDQLGVQEDQIAVDTTGLRPTQASPHFEDRRGRPYREFFKPGYAVGTASQYILGWCAGRGPSSDAPALSGLRRQAARYGRRDAQGRHAWQLLGDKGFDGRAVQPGDLIPPIRRGGKLNAPHRRAQADLVAAARLDGIYGQRWKCETVNSVIKRKFGDTIRSRKYWHQFREMGLKAVVYNLHRLPVC